MLVVCVLLNGFGSQLESRVLRLVYRISVAILLGVIRACRSIRDLQCEAASKDLLSPRTEDRILNSTP